LTWQPSGLLTTVKPPALRERHDNKARQTNHIERFNNTLRQRVSRLVCSALSFSKKLDNHIGAIQYFRLFGISRSIVVLYDQ